MCHSRNNTHCYDFGHNWVIACGHNSRRYCSNCKIDSREPKAHDIEYHSISELNNLIKMFEIMDNSNHYSDYRVKLEKIRDRKRKKLEDIKNAWRKIRES